MVKIPPGGGQPLPVPNALLLCDWVIREQGSGKNSLIGVFENINVNREPTPENPILHPGLTLYAKITGAEGTYHWRFELVRLRDNHTLASGDIGDITYPDRLQANEMVVGIRLVPLFELGRYEFRLYADDRLVAFKTFDVLLLKWEKS